MRRNFEILKNEIEELTRETANFITLRRGAADARGFNKGFHIRNIVTNSSQSQFRNLEEVEFFIENCLKEK
ncbi:MAG: hypothetical protein ACRC0V_01915 [Fusobacteriaceae bacterium]